MPLEKLWKGRRSEGNKCHCLVPNVALKCKCCLFKGRPRARSGRLAVACEDSNPYTFRHLTSRVCVHRSRSGFILGEACDYEFSSLAKNLRSHPSAPARSVTIIMNRKEVRECEKGKEVSRKHVRTCYLRVEGG